MGPFPGKEGKTAVIVRSIETWERNHRFLVPAPSAVRLYYLQLLDWKSGTDDAHIHFLPTVGSHTSASMGSSGDDFRCTPRLFAFAVSCLRTELQTGRSTLTDTRPNHPLSVVWRRRWTKIVIEQTPRKGNSTLSCCQRNKSMLLPSPKNSHIFCGPLIRLLIPHRFFVRCSHQFRFESVCPHNPIPPIALIPLAITKRR